jgi:hypothetical protein
MRKLIFFGVTNLFFLSSIAFSQVVPTPVINNEIRDNTSIRSREIELERVKRDSRKPNLTADLNGRVIKFSEIKEDFESIQKLQNSIVKIYTTGKKIRYEEIGKLALEINKSAMRLNSNLFTESVAEKIELKKEEKSETKSLKSVKEIIVDLDNNIGGFAKSSMFQNLKVIDTEVSEKTRMNLKQIIKLSAALNQTADKMAKMGK